MAPDGGSTRKPRENAAEDATRRPATLSSALLRASALNKAGSRSSVSLRRMRPHQRAVEAAA